MSNETKQIFEQYFDNGMSASEAFRYHESMLMFNEKPWEKLANASINPTKNVVYYLHRQWTLKNYGAVFEPIPKLQEKLTFYETRGMKVVLATNPWAVAVVTSIMQRAQQLNSSKEIIFCDSTSSCDSTETTVTILLTVTKAGAIPIAVLLHDGQSIASYEQAYGLLKKTIYCFGRNTQPLKIKQHNIQK
ncbi:uncharacterized protein LOC111691967 [Anoplophora glabripennis]|uniref:uncharacterized protein LOC111691967 n=1 Tax=Anoplophora glabripennis TaxID=217634 RepID=UPI000C7653F5|nr:uncharacterized protein LOC111691967 [Anoplophora glabripennis]